MRDKTEDSSKAECTTKSRRVEALSPQEDRSIKKRMILRRRGFGAIEKIRNACVNSGRVLIVLTGKKHRTVEAVPNQYRKTEQQQGDFGFVLGNTRRRNPKSYW
jgi:acetolactate synthase regulatory subunit